MQGGVGRSNAERRKLNLTGENSSLVTHFLQSGLRSDLREMRIYLGSWGKKSEDTVGPKNTVMVHLQLGGRI